MSATKEVGLLIIAISIGCKPEPAGIGPHGNQPAMKTLVGKWSSFGSVAPGFSSYAHLLEINEDGTFHGVGLSFAIAEQIGEVGRSNEKGAALTWVDHGKVDLKTGHVELTERDQLLGMHERFFVRKGDQLICEMHSSAANETFSYSLVRE